MITIENTREHDVGINLPQEFLNVPAAKQDPEDRNRIINGSVEADEDFIRRAMEAHEVVKFYFNEGWLKVVSMVIDPSHGAEMVEMATGNSFGTESDVQLRPTPRRASKAG